MSVMQLAQPKVAQPKVAQPKVAQPKPAFFLVSSLPWIINRPARMPDRPLKNLFMKQISFSTDIWRTYHQMD